MYVFTMPADKWDEQNPDRTAILQLILKHTGFSSGLGELKKYYEGRHKILEEEDRQNKLVCNHAKDISDTATAYFIGEPVTYKSIDDIVSNIGDTVDINDIIKPVYNFKAGGE